jgi:hypothetical protein
MEMNSGFRPIDPRMPPARAADLMVRRGECHNFHVALTRVLRSRRRDYGRVETTPALKAEINASFSIAPPSQRLPYKDE